jgi:hypothetical protein
MRLNLRESQQSVAACSNSNILLLARYAAAPLLVTYNYLMEISQHTLSNGYLIGYLFVYM